MIENHRDWKIHKRLREVKDEQRIRSFMFMVGRGNGKTRLLEEELDYIFTQSKPDPIKLDKSYIENILMNIRRKLYD